MKNAYFRENAYLFRKFQLVRCDLNHPCLLTPISAVKN